MRPTVDGVDNRQDVRQEVREFLTTRAPASPRTRPGFRPPGADECRDCGAARSRLLAGLSVEYYARSSGARSPAHHPASSTRSPGAAARRDRTRAPLRPRPRRRRHPDLGPRQAPHPAKAASRLSLQGVGGHHRRRRVRPGPAPEPPRHQHPRPSVLLARPRRRWPHAEPGPVPVPRSCLARLLPRLGPVRRDVRRHHASRGRTRSARPRTPGPRRRAPPAARRSGDCGPTTTSAPTAPAPRGSATPSSASSPSPTRSSPSPPNPGLVLLVYTAEPGSVRRAAGPLASWAAPAETATPTSITHDDAEGPHADHAQLRRHRQGSR